jgi:peptide/nickel transport system substrate-binding protein
LSKEIDKKENLMRISLLILVVGVAIALIIAGCSSNTATTPPVTTPAQTTANTPAQTVNPPVQTTTTAPAITASTASATSKPSASPVSSKSGGILRWVETVSPSTPIGLPSECSGPSGLTPQIALETLLKEQLGGAIKPGLVASYDVSTNPPSLTFHLQKGVKFSDGTDFNAQAAKWNLDKIKASALYASNAANWKSIDVVDDYTIKVSFNTWLNTIIPDFCNQMTYQISPAAYDKNGIDWIRWHMVGTGPFLMTDFQRDVTLTAARNPNYWQPGKPYLDGFKYFFVSDEMTREALFKSGGADVLNTNGNGQMANRLKDAGYIIVTQIAGPNMLVPDSANSDSPWSNLKVRQAAEYAIDKGSISTTFGFGWWTAVYQFSNPASMSYDSSLTPRKYDVAKAKQLLTEAGYPNGFKTSIIASPLQINRDMVIAIQAQLAKVGIQAEAQFPESAKWTEISTNTWKNAILVTGIFDRGNQNATFNYFLGVPATTWKSVLRPDGWAETLAASKSAPNQDPALLKKLEKMVDDNVLCIPIEAGNNAWVMTKNVQDTGEGTRGQANWIEPQDTWMSK